MRTKRFNDGHSELNEVDVPVVEPACADSSVRRIRRVRRWLWVAVAIALPVSVGITQATRGVGDANVSFPMSELVGRAAPNVEGRDVMAPGSSVFRLGRGRWTVVTFFATWCVPCRKEQPELVRFVAAHSVRGDAGVVSVIYQDDPLAVRTFQREHGDSWPVLVDPGGVIASTYGVLAVPETFVVDPGGVVVASVLGRITSARLDRIMKAHPSSTSVSTFGLPTRRAGRPGPFASPPSRTRLTTTATYNGAARSRGGAGLDER